MSDFRAMKTLIVSIAVFQIVAGVLSAQVFPPVDPPTTKPAEENESRPTRNARGFWQAMLAGGEFVVSTDKITSVSRHSYLLDGTLVVDEVTIDTTGQALARFYFITPVGANTTAGGTVDAALEKAKGVVDSAGQRAATDLENMVIKKYPDTTHAKTIEYRIATKQELTNLFNSAREAWLSGDGGQYGTKVK